jgi:hypothetical protein
MPYRRNCRTDGIRRKGKNDIVFNSLLRVDASRFTDGCREHVLSASIDAPGNRLMAHHDLHNQAPQAGANGLTPLASSVSGLVPFFFLLTNETETAR